VIKFIALHPGGHPPFRVVAGRRRAERTQPRRILAGAPYPQTDGATVTLSDREDGTEIVQVLRFLDTVAPAAFGRFVHHVPVL
jgi:hypothetical protein